MTHWTPPERNWESPEQEAAEAPYVRFHDGLADAYYNHWVHGESKPFHGFDKQATPEATDELFRKLEAWLSYRRAVDKAGTEEDHPVETEEGIITVSEWAAEQLLVLANEGIEISDVSFYNAG